MRDYEPAYAPTCLRIQNSERPRSKCCSATLTSSQTEPRGDIVGYMVLAEGGFCGGYRGLKRWMARTRVLGVRSQSIAFALPASVLLKLALERQRLKANLLGL